MRALVFLASGFVLLAACMLLGRLFSANYASAMNTATLAFLALWLTISGFNLWVRVSKTGRSLNDEQRFFHLIFWVPAAVAIFVKWRFF
jgi:hypothetical protein